MLRGRLTPMTPYTDILSTGWVARLPASWVPYVHLARLDRPIGGWLLFLPGLWSISLGSAAAGQGAWHVALFFAGAFLMRSAGCVVNDMWDREMDRKVTRTAGRPLASGALGMREAAAFLAVLLGLSLLILLQLNPLSIALGVGSLVLVVTYPLAKRVTWWPQLMLGFTFGWAAPMGYAAASGRLDAPGLLLYAAAIVWILGYDTIYAHQDREDDALVGVRSTARLFAQKTAPFLAVCYMLTLALLALAGWTGGLSAWFFAAMLLPAALLARQIVRLDVDDPGLCLALFRSNRDVGLAIGLAVLLGRL